MKLFRCFKFITGLLPPSHFDTRKRLLRYWFLHGNTGCIAPFSNISLSSSLRNLNCSGFKTGGLGDFPCTGFSRKRISNPWTIFMLFMSCISSTQFEQNNFSLPAKGTSRIGSAGNRSLTSGCTLLTLKQSVTQGNFVWWDNFWEWDYWDYLDKVLPRYPWNCGWYYFGAVVGLDSMYVLSVFWRAPSWLD